MIVWAGFLVNYKLDSVAFLVCVRDNENSLLSSLVEKFFLS